MKKLAFKVLFIFILTLSCENSNTIPYHQNEITFVVEMDPNQQKSNEEIAEFSWFYTEAVKETEPMTLGWGFFESGDKVILIERYTDGDAMMQHGKNISEGGPLESHFIKFMDHFTINKIDVYGDATEELKAFVASFGLPFYFHQPHAKFSRN